LLLLGVLGAVSACVSRDVPPAAATAREAPVIVFFGDSITRGQGIDQDHAFPALIQHKLEAEGLSARCVNAGVSGDTTESALDRLDSVVRSHPSVVVVELGANDAFKGVNRLRTKQNLQRILTKLHEAGARVILARTVFPHVQHPAYTLSMERTFSALAKANGATFVPDMMAGVAGVPELNLADGVHPNVTGHEKLAENLWPVVRAEVVALH
jgi:acyl-CoA thioesterase-1